MRKHSKYLKKSDKYSPAYCLRLLANCRLNNEEEILHDYKLPKRTGDIAWLELCIGNKEKAH